LRAASDVYSWNLNLSEIARIWKAGCIIRAKLLDPISRAYTTDPALDNLTLDPFFTEAVNSGQSSIRQILKISLDFGIPTPALSSSLNYIDTYRQANLPANLIQAQRDFFGAHTYKRTDREGIFHTELGASSTSQT
ncbi:MAG: hypothetical protein WKF81_05500, partial [Thermomicrobiales bacterium]